MSACHNVSWLLCVSQKPWELQLSGVRELCARVPVCVPVRCESWRASSVCTCVPPCPCMGKYVLAGPRMRAWAASSERTCHRLRCVQAGERACLYVCSRRQGLGGSSVAGSKAGGKERRLARFGAAAESVRGVRARRCVSASSVSLLWRDFNPQFSAQGQNPPEREHRGGSLCSSQGVSSSSGRFREEGQRE